MNESTPQPTDAGGSSSPSASDDDDRVMELFEMALAQPEAEQEEYLRTACVGDNELLECVLGYIRNEKRLRGFLEEPLLPPPPLEKPFVENQLIDGRFRIIREVARGAMGIVYEAFDETLERRIAIKCAQVGFHKRLPPEVINAREISHPNVCTILDLHNATTSEGKINFITMEFLEGETLAQRLERGRLSEEEALLLARQLCAGLAEAHRNHVIHGDLKASNIILASNGGTRAVITDFGLARRPESVQRAVQSGARGGTP